ncbi:hypothetical protein TIFTF001_011672 [Ficus carica]|uniref:WAT1-related protein n=1 Tax=Ficus carica TaxID=3494 RepID=A0AA87ZS67_FICCA|nr:hypothetical protein TIFTF001_011672 [Ficus carica]
MAGGCDCKKEALAFTAMAAIAFINVGLSTLYKAAAIKGLSNFVLITYSNAIGTLVLLPFLFIFPRTGLPPFSKSVLYKFVLLSLIGYSAGTCAYKGIEYSSPTLASVIGNLVPAFTFILAVVFRMETLDFRSSRTQAKTIGTIISISGALVAILYKGPVILSSTSLPSSLLLEHSVGTSQTNWVLGGLLLVIVSLMASYSYILQTQIVKLYPSALMVAILNSLCTAIIAAIVGPIIETNTSAWKVKTDMGLITVVLHGVFGQSLATAVHTWGLDLKGPVYVTIFQPFSIAIAAALGVTFLGDALHLGSVVGAMTILLGFYAVIWGKAKEETTADCSSDSKTPLLRSYRGDNTFVE